MSATAETTGLGWGASWLYAFPLRSASILLAAFALRNTSILLAAFL
jgi:hypothetical protein